jgi:hypothetical protein
MNDNKEPQLSQKTKIAVIIACFGIIFLLTSFFAKSQNFDLFIAGIGPWFLAITLIGSVALITYLLFSYIKHGSKKSEILADDEELPAESLENTAATPAPDGFDGSLDHIRLSQLEIDINSLKIDKAFVELDYLSLKKEVVEDLSILLTDSLADAARKVAEAEEERKLATARRNVIASRVRSAVARLGEEIDATRSTNTVNLLIGVMIAIIGMMALAYSVFDASISLKTGSDFSLHFASRATFAIIIEVFAYFFLNLYKKGQTEIRRLQNEISNFEMKYIGLRATLDFPEKTIFSDAVKEFIKAERNTVLEKGQTTVELEIAKNESIELRNAMKYISSAFRGTQITPKKRKHLVRSSLSEEKNSNINEDAKPAGK